MTKKLINFLFILIILSICSNVNAHGGIAFNVPPDWRYYYEYDKGERILKEIDNDEIKVKIEDFLTKYEENILKISREKCEIEDQNINICNIF